MTRIMLPLIVLICAVPAGAAERRYTVNDFDKVQVEGPFQVVLKTGKASSATAVGSSAGIDRVAIDVQGMTLRIRENRSAWGGYPGQAAGPARIEISTNSLRAATVGGSGSLAIDKAKAMRFDLALSGSGRISLAGLEADTLMIGILGSGSISVAGKAKSLRATIQGAGNLEAEGLAMIDADINADTAGRVAVQVQRTAKVISTGLGDTQILGRPSCTVKQVGSGQVLCAGSNQGQR